MLTKSNSNSKRALAASGLSLVLCFAMLIGTTFAWFSDSVSNKGNKITAGDLKIGFYGYSRDAFNDATLPPIGNTSESKPSYNGWNDLRWSADPVFVLGTDGKPAQPGDSMTRYVAIRNEGSIPLKYYLDFVVEDGGLGDAVTLTFTEVKPTTGQPVTVAGSQLESQKINGSSATKGEFTVYKMEMKFLESAGNTYQGGTFTVDLNLTATQDKEGARNALLKVKDEAGFASATANSTVVFQKNITLTNDVTLGNCNIDLNGYTLDLNGKTLKIENTTDFVTADVEDGKMVNGKLVFNLPNGSASLSSALTNVDCDVTVSSNTFIFSGKSNKSIVINQGKIQVKSDNAIVITIPSTAQDIVVEDKRSTATTEIIVDVASGATGTVVVQNPSNGGDVTVSGDGAGNVTVTPPTSKKPSWLNNTKVPSLSGTTYKITSAKELAWVSKSVLNGETFKGKTVALENDIDLSGRNWVPIGRSSTYDYFDDSDHMFQGTFEGNGHTVLNMEIVEHNVDRDLGFFGVLYNATVNRLKVTGKITVSGEIACYSSGPNNYSIGGFCGSAQQIGTVISKCTSSVDIDASKITSLEGTENTSLNVAGLVAMTGSDHGGHDITIVDCLNEGNISVPPAGVLSDTDYIFVAGVINGYQPTADNVLNTGIVPDEENRGEFFYSAPITAMSVHTSSNESYFGVDGGLYSTTGKYVFSGTMLADGEMLEQLLPNPLYNLNRPFTEDDFKGFDFENVWIMGSNGYPVLR